MDKLRPNPVPTDIQSEVKQLANSPLVDDDAVDLAALERSIRFKIDLRLCTIAGILCSLNLLDSGVISSASVTTMLVDLGLDEGNRYSVAIFILTISQIAFQLPSTVACRTFGPRLWFALITFSFGLITLCTAFITSWRQMIALRVLLGMCMSGIYPGLTYLISTYYTRKEQQLRFAFLQSGEVIILGTGSIVNFGLNQLDSRAGLKGWQWMFLVQGLITCVIGLITYFWMVDFPENSHRSVMFLTKEEGIVATARIEKDRGDAIIEQFSWARLLSYSSDLKILGFCVMFFQLNIVSTALSYFSPIILQGGMGFSSNDSILLSAPPYYYAVVPTILSSWIGDKYQLRGPIIMFNALTLISGFGMLGFSDQTVVRYAGIFLATGAYVANWAALNAYMANNITGQWKRVFTAASITMFNGAGGIAGSFIVRGPEAPQYLTAIWVSIGSHVLMIAMVFDLLTEPSLTRPAAKWTILNSRLTGANIDTARPWYRARTFPIAAVTAVFASAIGYGSCSFVQTLTHHSNVARTSSWATFLHRMGQTRETEIAKFDAL